MASILLLGFARCDLAIEYQVTEFKGRTRYARMIPKQWEGEARLGESGSPALVSGVED